MVDPPVGERQDVPLAGVAEWQTRRIQNPILAREWGFKSPLRHHQLPARGTSLAITRACVLLSALSSCAGIPTTAPSTARTYQAAWDAATDSRTWIPAAASAGFLILNADEAVSDWAQEHTPIFQTTSRAQEKSDSLRTLAHRSMDLAILSNFYVYGNTPQSWKQVGLGYGAAISSTETAGGLKALVDRDRPHPAPGSPSWPSQHATRAFAYSASARESFGAAGLNNPLTDSVILMGDIAAIGCAWARIEAGAHYPSDVLAGAALGNFAAIFLQRVFTPADSVFSLSLNTQKKEYSMSLAWDF